jgi:hypothetical protein
MTSLRTAWAALRSRLEILEPLDFNAEAWSVLEGAHADFQDRAVHIRLPLPIARFHATAQRAIIAIARQFEDVVTAGPEDAGPDPLAPHARAFARDLDTMLAVLIPAARYRKGHHAYGRFTVASPFGLHTDHSAEDPAAAAEPICLARIQTLGTYCVTGDDRRFDVRTKRMLTALRYWTPIPEGEPEAVLETLLHEGRLTPIPVNHVVLMVAGNGAGEAQITQHIAARPPEGGLHSALFQRHYRLAPLTPAAPARPPRR